MNQRNSKGFSIVEVLVSMVILSIGVLALSVLQLSSMQNTQGGHMRSQATMLAYDIIDAMRANRPGVEAGAYAMVMQQDDDPGQSAGNDGSMAITCYGIEANCSATQMAAADLARWRTVLGTQLPSGAGQIVTAAGGAGSPSASVTVSWIDPYSAGSRVERVTLQALIQ